MYNSEKMNTQNSGNFFIIRMFSLQKKKVIKETCGKKKTIVL